MKAKKYLMAFFAIAVLSSCSQEEEFVPDNGQSSYDKNVVTFGTYLKKTPETRATETTIDVMKGEGYTGFGVFAYNTGAKDFPSSTENASNEATAGEVKPDFMCNQQVQWDSSQSAWVYSPVKEWPEWDNVSFFAYAPYAEAAGKSNITALPTAETTGAPVISFAVDEAIDKQIDFLYADAKTNISKQTVQFNFNHALSRIGFKAKLTGDAGNKGSVTINKITFKSSALATSGKFNLQTGEWTESSPGEMEYTFEASNFETGSNTLTLPASGEASDPVLLTGNGNYLMLIPTGKDKNAKMEITVNYTETLEDGTKTNITFTNPFEYAFEQGKAYNFVLSIGLTEEPEHTNVKFEANVESWDSTNPDGSDRDIAIDDNIATLSLLAACPLDTYVDEGNDIEPHFADGSARLIIKVPCGEENEIKYTLPAFADPAHQSDGPVAARKYIEENMDYGWLFLAGWSLKPVKYEFTWDDYPTTADNLYPDPVVVKYTGGEITLKKGETTTLYPVWRYGGLN